MQTASGLLLPNSVEHEIALPRVEFPRLIRGLGDALDRRLSAMMPLAGMLGPLAAGSRVAPNVLASVPWVAQWKFNNNANDSIGSNNLTASASSPTFTTGLLGGATGATQLTAINSQYWYINSNATLQTGDIDFTIAMWVWFDSLGARRGLIARWNDTGSDYEYLINFDTSDNHIYFAARYANNTGQATVKLSTLGVPATGQWHCLIFWHDAANNTLNAQANNGGVDSIPYTAGVRVSNAQLTIGTKQNRAYFMNGRIDNVCFAKSVAGGGGVLTAAQRTAFYNAGAGTEQIT